MISTATRLVGLLAVYSCLLCAPALAQVNGITPWPTTDFEVRHRLPDDDDIHESLADRNVEGSMNRPVHVSISVQVRIENHLKRVAKYLEAQGFRAPNLPLEKSEVQPETDKLVYVIYVYNARLEDAPASYHHGCSSPDSWIGTRPFMQLNAVPTGVTTTIDRDKLTDFGYQALTHELFHAVQYSYPFWEGKGCGWKKWVTEGTARAVEVHVEETLRLRSEVSYDDDYKYWLQPRRYNKILPLRAPESGRSELYGTASFWMYLAELAAAGKNNLPGVLRGERDYRYLQEFFDIAAEGQGVAADLRWLNTAMRRTFNRSLPGVYSDFITMTAGYVNGRAWPEIDPAAWREALFGKCPKYTLNESIPRVDFTLVFKPVSARCIDVNIESTEEVELLVLARNKGAHMPDPEALSGIHVGVPGTYMIDQSDIAIPPQQQAATDGSSEPVGVWKVRYLPGVDEALIFSNVANIKSKNPNNGPIAFTILHPAWYTSLGDKPAAGDTGSADSPAPARSDAGALNPEEEASLKRSRRDLESFSSTTTGAVNVERRASERACAEPFKYVVCGPVTLVSLKLTPGTFGELGASSGRGGALAQFGGTLKTLGGATDGGQMTAYTDWVEKVTAIDGHQIGIAFPLIDYGFTGTFKNAYISVQMSGKRTWETIGPADVEPGAVIRFPISGSVTISEYSPDLMVGEFSGELVDRADLDVSVRDPVLPVRHTLSGRFVIAAPLMSDVRTRSVSPADYSVLVEDIEYMFPGVGANSQGRADEGSRVAPSAPPNQQSSSATGGLPCDCSCNYIELASDMCKDQCKTAYLACAGERFTGELPEPVVPTAGVLAEIAALRQQYEAFLVEKFDAEEVRISLLLFDGAEPTLEAKQWYVKWRAPHLVKE